jgi:two-component system response regulator HydG
VRRLGKTVEGFASDARALLLRYRWPGNVRELEHAVQRAAILTGGPTISAADLGLPDRATSAAPGFPAAGHLADLERYWVLTTRARCGGNQSATAQALGIDRSTLHRKLRQYGDARV